MMDERAKLALLEDMMDLDEGELNAETVLADFDGWDSMTKLSLIVLMDEDFSVKLEGDTIRGLKTVKDILKLMQK